MKQPAQTSGTAPPLATEAGFPEALGQSEAFLALQERLSRVAQVDRPVLLLGERGTGKELAARRLHHLSPRWQGPLVALNCAALAPTLVESELFGHEKGAFTGAERRRTGRFERADGGTLFLDEIGNIPLEVQEKILQVVEYGVFERVGGSRPVQVDVRIIGATHSDLAALARQGRFKQDLLDRLSFEVLILPPLRERREDILLLARHFAGRMALELGRSEAPEFSEAATRALDRYAWPGNVRELKNVVERATYRCESNRIEEILFDPFQPPGEAPPAQESRDSTGPLEAPSMPSRAETGLSFAETVQRVEIELLRQALEQTRYNQRKAARRLGLTYHQFRGLYRKHRHELDHREE